MVKKKAIKKKSIKTTSKKQGKTKNISDSLRLLEIERRTIRIEKLVMLLLDDSILAEREKERVREIERMVREGNIAELSELT